jgi:hypothetical protein
VVEGAIERPKSYLNLSISFVNDKLEILTNLKF